MKKKACLCQMQTIKGHLHSLISAIVIRCLDSMYIFIPPAFMPRGI